MNTAIDMSEAGRLASALAVGLLIGAERGWQERNAGDGERIAGIRSFALIGLFGGVCALLGNVASGLLIAGLVSLAVLLGVAWKAGVTQRQDFGITTLIAALLTYVLGALASAGHVALAAAAAVATTVLLDTKASLHGLLRRLRASELSAALQVLVLAAIVMPLLPRTPLDPWQLISPYEFGELVLLMAGLSFAGYAAVRIFGWRRGALLAGAAGGMVSSTAVIANSSLAMRRQQMPVPLATVSMLAACGVMGMRVLLLCSLIAPAVALRLILPAALMTLPLLPFLRAHTNGADAGTAAAPDIDNPMSIWSAIRLAALLALVLAGVQLARSVLGERGLLYAAAIGGIADVDAITLSLARLFAAGQQTGVIPQGILIAMLVNTLVKAAMAAVLGGRAAARGVSLPLLLSAAGGGAVLLLRMPAMQ